MSFGLRTWNEEGVLEMDTDSFTYQVMYSATYTMGGTNTLTIPIAGFTPDKCVAVILPLGVKNPGIDLPSDAMPYIYQNNGSVTLSSRPAGSTSQGSRISFRLLAMRLRN